MEKSDSMGKILSVDYISTHSMLRSLMRSLGRMGKHTKEYPAAAEDKFVQSEKIGQLSH